MRLQSYILYCIDLESFEKIENAGSVMAAYFKSKTHLKRAIFIFELFELNLIKKLKKLIEIRKFRTYLYSGPSCLIKLLSLS